MQVLPDEPAIAVALLGLYSAIGVALIANIGNWIQGRNAHRKQNKKLDVQGKKLAMVEDEVVSNGHVNMRSKVDTIAAQQPLILSQLQAMQKDLSDLRTLFIDHINKGKS